MSRVQIDNISIENAVAAPADTIRLGVTFSALEALAEPLTWSITYIGSAFSEAHDQLLEEFEVGPIAEPATMTFALEADPPVLSQVPREELLCTAAMILSVSYRAQEFIRIGYYVVNTYRGDAEDPALLPIEEVLAHADRVIIHDKPRVTKFEINWQDDPLPHPAHSHTHPLPEPQAQSPQHTDPHHALLEKKESSHELKQPPSPKLHPTPQEKREGKAPKEQGEAKAPKEEGEEEAAGFEKESQVRSGETEKPSPWQEGPIKSESAEP